MDFSAGLFLETEILFYFSWIFRGEVVGWELPQTPGISEETHCLKVVVLVVISCSQSFDQSLTLLLGSGIKYIHVGSHVINISLYKNHSNK